MLSLRNINPMVRAVGTMGAIAAIVGGVTFAANLDQTTVKLTNNSLTSATASLAIAGDDTCAPASLTTSVQGMNFNNLLPGIPSAQFPFCLDNTGNTPLSVTVSTPTSFSGSTIASKDVTLDFTCGVGGATTGAVDVSATLKTLGNPVAFGSNPLNNGTNNIYSCNVTATLDSSVTQSNASVTPFELDFTGTSGGASTT